MPAGLLPFLLLCGSFPSVAPISAAVDCDFDRSELAQGFCAWRPDSEQSARVWHTGNAVLVDAANSVVRSPNGGDRFAFVQGRFGAPTEGTLRSGLVQPADGGYELRLNYWKASVTPSLDICVEEDPEEPLRCVDTVQGPGQQQWVHRSVELPPAEKTFRVVLRARNLLAAEDIIGVDEVRLQGGGTPAQAVNTNSVVASGVPKNPFEGMREEWEKTTATEQQKDGRLETRIFAVPEERGEQQPAAAPEAHLQHRHLPHPQPQIRPQIRMSPIAAVADGTESPILTATVLPSSPLLPDFGASASLFGPQRAVAAAVKSATGAYDKCTAVSCSFAEGPCLWELGPGWRSDSTEGSLSMEWPAQRSELRSAAFRAPVASAVDFDLWMSDDAELSVLQHLEGGPSPLPIPDWSGDRTADAAIPLFTRNGATEGGWHRFRVPLRPSLPAIRLLLRAQLSPLAGATPSGSFVSLSNVKLVNGDGEEVECDQTADDSSSRVGLSREAAPLQLPPFGFIPPTAQPFPLPSPLFPTLAPPAQELPQNSATATFNPLKPLFEGYVPIVPLSGNPLRLTALMDAPIREQSPEGTLPDGDQQGHLELRQQSEEDPQPQQGLLPFGAKRDEGEEEGERTEGLRRQEAPPEREMAPLRVLPRRRTVKSGRRQAQQNGGDSWPTLEMGHRDKKVPVPLSAGMDGDRPKNGGEFRKS